MQTITKILLLMMILMLFAGTSKPVNAETNVFVPKSLVKEMRAVSTNYIICQDQVEKLEKKCTIQSNMIELKNEQLEIIEESTDIKYYIGAGLLFLGEVIIILGIIIII